MNNVLHSLPESALRLLGGEPRKRLISYLHRWEAHAALMRALDIWMQVQPGLVLLREARARVLADLGRPLESLVVLDEIDAERGVSAGRRSLRVHALLAAGQYAEARALITPLLAIPEQALAGWLAEGDIRRAAGDLPGADQAYRQALAIDPEAAIVARRLARLALDRGDAEEARGYIEAALLRDTERQPAIDDLRLLHAAALAQGDHAAVESLGQQLERRESEERAAIVATLKLDQPAAAPSPAAPSAPAPEPELPGSAYQLLREVFELQDFRPNQAQVIAAALAGRSTLAMMPTGAGKSLTYQLPALLLPQATVVVSPLIALMKDQLDGLPAAVRPWATAINSSLGPGETGERVRGVAEGRYRLVYIAPERLRQRPFLEALKRAGVSLLVVDEAHCVSMWGMSFRPDYLFIGRARQELGNPPLLAVTATASRETQAEIRACLGDLQVITASIFRPNLRFEVVPASNREARAAAVLALCQEIDGAMIIYARARAACEDLAGQMRAAGIAADFYHAQVPNRGAVQERFMCGETRVLVATIAFGMGIDKPDIRGIIHYNVPQSIEAYYQEAGRAGRDGRPARCVLLYSPADKGQLKNWLREEAITRDDLRGLYRAVRNALGGRPYGVVSIEALSRASRPDDDTFGRVGLSMLERVGLVRRHFDLPRSASVLLRRASGSPELLALAAALQRLTPQPAGKAWDDDTPGRAEIDLVTLSADLGRTPGDLDAWLLAQAASGTLSYAPAGRDALLELLPAPPNVGDQIDQLLADYQERQDQRVEAVGDYARAAACRHSVLARHFGQRLGRCVNACDICQPAASSRCLATIAAPAARRSVPLAERPNDAPPDAQVVLAGLAELPFPMGRSGLARALKGSGGPVEPERFRHYGALAHLPVTQIEGLIERLLDEGFIARDEHHTFRLLELTSSGRRARKDPAYLPEWAVEVA